MSTSYEEKSRLFELQQKYDILKDQHEKESHKAGFFGHHITVAADSSGSLRSPEKSSARMGWPHVSVRETLIKSKKELKKKCRTIDKLTDLLSRYEKTLSEMMMTHRL